MLCCSISNCSFASFSYCNKSEFFLFTLFRVDYYIVAACLYCVCTNYWQVSHLLVAVCDITSDVLVVFRFLFYVREIAYGMVFEHTCTVSTTLS